MRARNEQVVDHVGQRQRHCHDREQVECFVQKTEQVLLAGDRLVERRTALFRHFRHCARVGGGGGSEGRERLSAVGPPAPLVGGGPPHPSFSPVASTGGGYRVCSEANGAGPKRRERGRAKTCSPPRGGWGRWDSL